MPNLLSLRDLVIRPDNMDETVLHAKVYIKSLLADAQYDIKHLLQATLNKNRTATIALERTVVKYYRVNCIQSYALDSINIIMLFY